MKSCAFTAAGSHPLRHARTPYDRISRAYALVADAREAACRERGLEMLRVCRGEHVLEIGCGTGSALVPLSHAVGEDGQIYGVDVSVGMLAIAATRVREEGRLRAVSLVLGDARALSFRNGGVDAAFLSFTLELFPPSGLSTVLQETYRVLRPGGRLVVVCMSDGGARTAASTVYQWLHRRFPRTIDCRPIPVHALLQQHAFDVLRADSILVWGLRVACVLAIKPLCRREAA